MGAGKSSVGKRLAKALKFDFIDSDRAIENHYQQTISEIFVSKGEAGFREMETTWLESIESNNAVIAVGGGTPCFNGNMDRMRLLGTTIYLELPPKTLVERLIKSKNERPLIAAIKHDEDRLLEFVKAKLNERKAFYETAHIRISGLGISSASLSELVRTIQSN